MTVKPKVTIKKQAAFPMIAEAMLRGSLTGKLAADAELDLKPILTAIGNGKTKLDLDKIMVAVDAALKPVNGKVKLATDADVADVREVLEQLSDMAPEVANMVVGGPDAPANSEGVPPGNPDAPDPDDNTSPSDLPIENAGENSDPADPDPDDDDEIENADPMAKVIDFLQGKLSPEDLDALKKIMGANMATDNKIPGVTKAAMDAAIATAVATAKTETETTTIARLNAVRAAEEAVRPYVAIKTAMDSADSVYKFALDKLGVKGLDKIHPSAYPALLAAHPLPGKSNTSPKRLTANDADVKSYTTLYGEFDKRLKA